MTDPPPPATDSVRPAPPDTPDKVRPLRPEAAWSGWPFGLPATWVFAALLVVGTVRVGLELADAVAAYPRATSGAIAIFAVYAMPFLAFIARVDYLEPEPRVLRVAAFCWGGLVARAVAVPANEALLSLLSKLVDPGFAGRWGPAVVGPTVEEPVKLLGIVMIVLIARRQINSLVDGLVYGAVVGLGYQVTENIVAAANAVALGGADRFRPVVETLVLRGFVAGLWSHTLFTALAGMGVAYAVLKIAQPWWRRIAVGALCCAGAWLCHFIWNAPMWTTGAGVLAEILIKGVPPLLLVLALARTTGNDEAAYYVGHLERLGDPTVVTADELAALRTSGGRAAACRAARERGGRRAAEAMRRLLSAQARLALALSRDADRSTPAVHLAYRAVLAARARLDEAGTDRRPRLVRRWVRGRRRRR